MDKILIFDNYDSFTYNLVQLIRAITGREPTVKRNDKITLKEVAAFSKILLSPGPGLPQNAGIMLQLIRHYSATKSILGICLGHQAIGLAFGGQLIKQEKVYHGVTAPLCLTGIKDRLFTGIPENISVGRYHSWILDKKGFPEALQITATDHAGEIMGIRHRDYDVQGLQFHPESVLTPHGAAIVQNWLKNELL